MFYLKQLNFSQLTSDVKFNYTKDSFATITYKYGDKSVGTAKVVYSSDSGKTDSTVTVASTTASQQTTTAANNTGNNKNSETAVAKETIRAKILQIRNLQPQFLIKTLRSLHLNFQDFCSFGGCYHHYCSCYFSPYSD
ncbi:MAG: hypothetical protein ACLRR3_00850 [Eubacterium sp.]